MSSGNGNSKWVMYLVGVIVTVTSTALFALAHATISNDKESRIRDDKMEVCIQDNVVAQKQINQDILIALKEIQVDMKYLRKSSVNGN